MAVELGSQPLSQPLEGRASVTERMAAPALELQEPCCTRALKQPTTRVILAVIFGLLLGTVAYEYMDFQVGGINVVKDLTLLLGTPGRLWLKALKCIVLPMIIFAMIDAMIMMRSLPGAKYVATAVVTWYTIFPLCAGTQACTYASLIILSGNSGANAAVQPPPQSFAAASSMFSVSEEPAPTPAPPPPSLLETLLGIADNMVPKNLVLEAADDNLLPVIVSAIAFGLLLRDKEEDGSPTKILQVCQDMNGVIFSVIGGIMSVTPYAISSLVFGAVSSKGLAGIAEAYILCVAVVVGLFSHFFIFYPTMIFVFAKRNPATYLLNAVPTFIQAIGTSSSAACLPTSIKVAVEGNKIAPHIANFVINLGATIGMDGTAIYLITAVIFAGNLQGKVFGIGDFLTLALMAALSAAGSAPIPNASMFLIQVIASAVGVQIGGDTMGLISAVDWALDRLRTTVNVAGDQTVAAILDAKFAGREDEDNVEITDVKVASFVKESRRSTAIRSGTSLVI